MKKISTRGLALIILGALLGFTFSSEITTSIKAVQANTGTPFLDIDESNPHFEAIQSLKTAGIVQGYDNNEYKHKNEMNRAEFVKVLIGSITKNPQGKNCFNDVREEWFAPYICEAKSRGIVQEAGADGKFFKPEEKIKFSEAAKITANIYQLQIGTADKNFWYKPFMTALQNAKAIPLSVEFFDENVDRGEMAEMVWRLKEKVSDKATRTFDEISGDGLVQAQSCADIQNRLSKANTGSYGDDNIMLERAMPMTTAPASGMLQNISNEGDAQIENTKSSISANDYSTTNIQVAGVDEADIIKNDGKYIYLIKGGSIRIIEAYPAENMKELINFSFAEKDRSETFYPHEMYVDGNTLTVIGKATEPYIYDSAENSALSIASPRHMPVYGGTRTKVYVLDVSNHSKPIITRSVAFDANPHSSRKIGQTLYMVMEKSPYYIPYYNIQKREKDIKPIDFLPQMLDSKAGKEEFIAPCNKILILPKPQNPQFLITAAIPLNNTEKEVKRNMIVGNAENIYASNKNLYVATSNWQDGYYKAYGMGGNRTAIYKFALNDGNIEYKKQGKVAGTILNQFSMDEHEDYFRIATTGNEYVYGNEMNNNLFILDSEMKEVGKIENIAPGEKIYSVRFMGDRAYMVTFKQIDPLFVIDTSDPRNPKILGKLKIPGYSNYLHPYDENHLMGFGHEVDESVDADKVHSDDAVYYTAVQGMKIGMFDVTDTNNPKEMFKEVIGTHGTTSELLNNHKALLFNKEKGLLAFPVTVNQIENQCSDETYASCPSFCRKICVPSVCTYENGLKICTPDCEGENSCVLPASKNEGKPVFQGAYVYNVNLQNGFTLKGKITHLNSEEENNLKENGYVTTYQKAIERIVYIGNTLYTVSQAAVKANNLGTMAEEKMLTLAGDITELLHYLVP